MSWERQVCIKSADELKIMREAGVINAEALKAAADACVPGNSTWDVNAAADAVLKKYHVVSAFKGVPGPVPYPASTCVSVNNILVHGIPSKNVVLKEGDIVSIDCGATLKGYVADSAVTVGVGKVGEEAAKDGVPYGPRQGLCLETQYYPNSVNEEKFPKPLFGPEKPFDSTTIYRFFVK